MIFCLTHPKLDSSQVDQRSGVKWENPESRKKCFSIKMLAVTMMMTMVMVTMSEVRHLWG